jgi:murein DD-endopeptidase MepM/ murein hydrolase activator NlpD
MGLSEIVPAGFKVLGKGVDALPWVGKQTTRAAQEEAATQAQQGVGEAIGLSRAAGGPVTTPPSAITQPTLDPNVQRVSIPAQNGSGPIDLTYHLDKNGKLNGVYDTPTPAPGQPYRPLTAADSQVIYDAWGRLPDPDRGALRQAAFPRMSRVETSPGEPFIESSAERLTDPTTGAPILGGDTGRIGTGYQREVDDLRRTILTSKRPDQIVTDFTTSWRKTLYDGNLHPLTRRSQAEHRLQTLRDVVDSLPPEFKTPEIQKHLRDLHTLLPKTPPADMFAAAYRWTGPTTGQGGRLVPVPAREASWLREMAALPVKAFKKNPNVDAMRVGANGGLYFERKPAIGAPDAFMHGYENYQTVQQFRLQNPPVARMELASLKGEVNSMRLNPRASAQSRQDAIADALERTGIVPNASALDADGLVMAIDNYLRTTKPTFPALPGISSGVPHGIYPPGSQDELWGIGLDDALRDSLDTQLDINGTSRTIGQRGFTHWEETATAQEIAKAKLAGRPLDAADEKALAAQLSRITTRFPGEYRTLTPTKLAAMEPGEIDRLGAALLKTDVQQSQGLRGATGKMLTPSEMKGVSGKFWATYDGFISKWRSTVLYNVARGIQYPMLQGAGNLLTPIIAGNYRAVPFYLNPRQWPRRVKYLRDPETAALPSVIEHLEKVGLPRDPNLGRVSRDQLGAKTGYNQADSWQLTKAAGTALGNQRIKDLADSIDTGLRQAAFESIFEPGYNRLKKDLTPMATQRFQRGAAAQGVPLNVSRSQIDAAIKQVESANGGYFNQVQLREALFEAGGGKSAANSKVLYDAADRTARDYHSELKKLSTLSNAEVDRLAFKGGETNLDASLQRAFMFTWWMKNATRLYATSAAGSPVQMALWARAIEAGEQRTREGTNPRFKQYIEFMKTPAGFTASLNPMSLLGTFLLGTSADPASPTANLTALGRFFGGGFVGENLILSPLINAGAAAIGAFGQDYRMPDVLGTGRIEREIVDALNYANQHWVTFNKTPGGNPERVPMPGFGPGMVNFLAQHISGIIPGTQKVAGYDPTAPAEGRMSALIAEQVLRDNPELDPADPMDAEILRRGIDLGMADHDSAHYQEALSRDVDAQYLGPGSSGTGGWRDVVGAVGSHFVLPTSFSRQPTYRADTLAQKGRDALRKEGEAPNLTTETEIDDYEKMAGTVGARSPEGRALELIRDAVEGDPQTMAVKDLSEGIRYGDLGKLPPEGVDINGIHYAAEDIAAIEDDEVRKDLANDWIKAAGYRPILDQYYANKTAHMENNAAYADGEGLPDYAKQYPGGVDRFVDDTAAVNPNYKAFVEGNVVVGGQQVSLPEMRVTDHDAWVAQVTAYDDAKNVIAGIKDSRYGLEIDPKYAGTVAGLSESVGAWKVRTDAEENAAFLAENPWIPAKEAIEPIGVVGPSNPGPLDWEEPIGIPETPQQDGGLLGAVGGAIGSMVDAAGSVVGTMFGGSTTPPTKPAATGVPFDLVPANDGLGVQSTVASDRTWMEDMIGPGDAAVTTEYKGTPPPNVSYDYQNGHGADGTTHAAYDISCASGDCVGTPMSVPLAGKVVCSGYGQGTGESLAGCTYSQNTTLPGQAHTIVLDVGTDAAGNPLQLSFNHMGTSAVTPGQQVNVGDALGTMGNTDAGPHVHLEGWAWSPALGTYVIIDPQLIVGGYYKTHSVDG